MNRNHVLPFRTKGRTGFPWVFKQDSDDKIEDPCSSLRNAESQEIWPFLSFIGKPRKDPVNPVNPVKPDLDRIDRIDRKNVLPFQTKGRTFVPHVKYR